MYGGGMNPLEQQLFGNPLAQYLFGPRRLPRAPRLPVMPRLGPRGPRPVYPPIPRTRLRYLRRQGYFEPQQTYTYARRPPGSIPLGLERFVPKRDPMQDVWEGFAGMSEEDRRTVWRRALPRLRARGLL